ncbi:MAG: hypothetical protein U0Y08_14540 [Bacteroidia bacterium]
MLISFKRYLSDFLSLFRCFPETKKANKALNTCDYATLINTLAEKLNEVFLS